MPNKKDTIEPIHASFDDVVSKMVIPSRNPRSDVLKALYTGSFWDILDLKVECYVLNDNTKTAVISQQGLQWLFDEEILSKCVGPDTMKKLYQPIAFEGDSGLPKFGYDAEVLADVCLSIVNPKHDNRESLAVHRAFAILRLAAKIGIAEVIYKACKYQKTSK
jgi:hypothetical protein